MGNQPVQEHELAWLAGVIDGEGCITISHSKQKGRSANYSYSVTIVNTNTELLGAVRDILDRLGVGHAVYEKTQRPGTKQSWSVAATSMTHIVTLLGAVRPYLVAKWFQADRMVELLARRSKVTLHSGPRRTYTRRDFEDMLDILERNGSSHGNGISETVRGELEALPS